MFRFSRLPLLFILIFWGDISAQPSQRSVEAGKVIIKLKPDVVSVFETRLRPLSKTFSDTSILNTGIKSFDLINRRYRASNMYRLFPDAGEYEAKHRRYGLHLWYEIAIPDGEDPETVAADYGADENVQIAEPRLKIRSVAMPATLLPLAEMPNDPDFNKQWNYHNTGQTGGTPGADIRLIDAWESIKSLGIRNKNVIVAVTDGGVYYDHEDLKDNMWVNEAELTGATGIDDDNNGYVDDIHGYNFVNRTGAITPENHATHVAGTIAAVTDNGIGVSGISGNQNEGYGIKIMTVQILDGNKSATSIVRAFTYAADNGAVISQNSWGYEEANVYSRSDIEAINYFINEAGKDKNGNPRSGTPMAGGMVIFAAGNDGEDDKWYPAYYDNVLAVAATNHDGKLAKYSNYGNWIDISAPGGELTRTNTAGGIYSTSYNSSQKNFYEYLQGTSMACPHVSGVAALILSVYGSEYYTPDMLRARLLNSATPLNFFDPENASKMGAGLVNASLALIPSCASGEPTNLTAQMLNAVSCRLNWEISSAENYGEPRFYSIACATEYITEANFDQYTLPPVIASQITETTFQTTLTGLLPATPYYIAIRNADKRCELSKISNVATVTTRTNRAPVVSNPLPDITLRDVAEETVFFIGNLFTDPDGDAMTCEILINSENIATVRVIGDIALIKPVSAGSATITITADDGNTGRTPFMLSLTITQNQPPVFDGLMTDTTLIPHSEPVVIDLSDYVSDPENDPVNFHVLISESGIVNANIKDNILTIDPRRHGNVTLLVTASDIYNAKTTSPVYITVEQKYASDKADRLLLYPNPTKQILWYSYKIDEQASVMVRIINSIGQLMYQTPVERRSAGTYYFNIDLQNWDVGMYVVQMIKNGKAVDANWVFKQ